MSRRYPTPCFSPSDSESLLREGEIIHDKDEVEEGGSGSQWKGIVVEKAVYCILFPAANEWFVLCRSFWFSVVAITVPYMSWSKDGYQLCQ